MRALRIAGIAAGTFIAGLVIGTVWAAAAEWWELEEES